MGRENITAVKGGHSGLHYFRMRGALRFLRGLLVWLYISFFNIPLHPRIGKSKRREPFVRVRSHILFRGPRECRARGNKRVGDGL